ncbi:class I SAM-dependent methyltransferase [Microvirga flavescens]|uniref:class I SAM-dependent methyltransferase n=1 Tax=Microvirga flavescens TaxID=2249811 RepID=UPI000DD5F5F3|nr:class I SAM-dependent methyltransferase [Microvirga flavescens]
MTRLDSAIRRLSAQRNLLNWAANEIEPTGVILELGLGNGRTYDHLRTRLPDREIYAFERTLAVHPDDLPPEDYLVLGDIFDTLPLFAERMGPACAALIHADIGSGDDALNRQLAKRLSPLLEPLLEPGGLVLADRAFDLPRCTNLSTRTGITEGRYFVYRRARESGRPVAHRPSHIA